MDSQSKRAANDAASAARRDNSPAPTLNRPGHNHFRGRGPARTRAKGTQCIGGRSVRKNVSVRKTDAVASGAVL